MNKYEDLFAEPREREREITDLVEKPEEPPSNW